MYESRVNRSESGTKRSHSLTASVACSSAETRRANWRETGRWFHLQLASVRAWLRTPPTLVETARRRVLQLLHCLDNPKRWN